MRRRPTPTTSPRCTGRCRRCCPSTGSTTSRRPPAARAARRAPASRRGSGCSPRRSGVAAASSPVAEARALACRVAVGADELALHYAIRRAVFCREQGMFGARDDRDERDLDPATLHAIGAEGGVVGGTVRLYALDDGGRVWQGDRLAVLPAFRHGSLGGSLVRFAVRTAGARGGERMVAMIQLANVRFFVALGWSLDGAVVDFHGRAHQPMAIALSPADG